MGIRIRENLLLGFLKVLYALDRRRPNPAELGTGRIKNILAVSCTAIGDTLLSTPGLRSLRLAYPEAKIDLMLNVAYVPLFENNPDIDNIQPYYGGFRRFFRLAYALRQRHYDLAVVFHGNEPQATPLIYLAGARFRFKLPNRNRFRFLLSNNTVVESWNDMGHGLDQRLKVAALAGGLPTGREMTLPVTSSSLASFTQRLRHRGIPSTAKLIGFQAGASTVSRRWELSRFVELAQRLLTREVGAWIVLTGSPSEQALANTIAEKIDSKRVWVSAGAVPLTEMPALMQSISVLITGDTGPMHMAVALRTPVVALFAPSDWRRSGPAYDMDRHFIIQKWITCDPCLSKRCPYSEPVCMHNITVDEVESAVIDSLHKEMGRVSDAREAACD